jgi:hypothetical protein
VTLIILAVLGIGIGVNVAIPPWPMPRFSGRSGFLNPTSWFRSRNHGRRLLHTCLIPELPGLAKQARSFEALGIAGVFEETLKRTGTNERILVAYVSEGFPRAYRIQPVLGRTISGADDQAGVAPIAVLSYRFWQTRFGADPGVVGRTLILDDQVWTIAGVMAPFRWNRTADVFVPIAFAQDKYGLSLRENHSRTGVIARLKPGVTLEQARAEMKVIAARLAKQYPDANGGNSAVVVPLREYIGAGMRHASC